MATLTDDDVRSKIAEFLEIAPERCTPDAVLTDLVTDSFVLVEMAIEVQDEYDVMFSQQDLAKVSTIADLTALVQSRYKP